MAKLKAPLISFEAFGTLAKVVTFRRQKRQTIAEKKPVPKDANTAAQAPQRLKFQDAVDWWHFLGPTEQAAYDTPGREHGMSGYAWFIRTYLLNPWPATFLSLTDVPDAYTGEAGHSPKVNAGETALDWGSIKEYPSGIVDIPSQSACSAYQSSDQTLTTAPVNNEIDWDTENYDVQNEFDLAGDRFTATRAGKYFCVATCQIRNLDAGKYAIVYVYKNGAAIYFGEVKSAAAAQNMKVTLPVVVDLDAGDFIEFYARHDAGANRDTYSAADRVFFTIAKIA